MTERGSCQASILISNTTNHDTYLFQCASFRFLQLISFITSLDVKLVQMPETSVPVDGPSANEKAKDEPTIEEPNKQFFPEANVIRPNGQCCKSVETMLCEECETFSKSEENIGCV